MGLNRERFRHDGKGASTTANLSGPTADPLGHHEITLQPHEKKSWHDGRCFRITAIPLEVSGSAFASSGERFASDGKGFFVVAGRSPLTGKRSSVMLEQIFVMLERSSLGGGGVFVVRKLAVVVLIDIAVVANGIGGLRRKVRVRGKTVSVVAREAVVVPPGIF